LSQSGKIQQQYYTRGRSGVFRTNEGLDTVAKSPSLDNNFIKKTLHPFCLYHAPQELRQRGEEDVSKYPESLTVFTAETGELVIGRGVFAGADFTGQRDTVFLHHYIVPQELAESVYRLPNSIFRITSFASKYNEAIKELPELDELEYDKQSYVTGQQHMLDRLGIDEALFKQLLWSVCMSISSNKKVYIALDVDVSESSLYANQLLELLYHCLPYGMRRKFGFTTYSHEPQGKKYIDVMVVEKGSIRSGDRQIDKDYLFDFPNRRFVNTEPLGAEMPYLDFAWAYRGQPAELEAFFDFAEEALQDVDAQTAASLPAYHQLNVLYQIEQGGEEIYESKKEAIVTGILTYLNDRNVESKPRLDELFWQLAEREISLFGKGHTLSLGYVEAMIDYYRIGGLKENLVFSLIKLLYNGWNFHEDSGYPNRVFDAVLKHEELFQAVAHKMLATEQFAPVLQAYMLDRIQQAGTMQALQEEISFWLKHIEDAVGSAYFQEQLMRRTKELLEKDRERIASGGSLNVFLDMLYKSDTGNTKRLQRFYNDLDVHAQKTIIGKTDLDQVTLQQLESMKYMLGNHSHVLTESLGPRDQAVFHTLQCASYLLRNVNSKEAECYMVLSRLMPKELDQLQALLQRVLKGRARPENYEKIAYAFYENGLEPGECSFAFMQMLAYIRQEADHADEIYDFIHWSAGYAYFHLPNMGITKEYEAALRGYFLRSDRGALNKKHVWLKLKSIPNASMRKVLTDIRLAQANPLIRFMKGNRKMLIQFGSIFVGVAVLVTIGIVGYQTWFQPVQPVQQVPGGDPGQNDPLLGPPAPGTESGTGTGAPTGSPSGGQTGSGTPSGGGTSPGGTTVVPPLSGQPPIGNGSGSGTGSSGGAEAGTGTGAGSGTGSNTGTGAGSTGAGAGGGSGTGSGATGTGTTGTGTSTGTGRP